ncbi:MAG: hypothetical protein NT126_09960 [Bacteroidetes bacterium]|nr:hypothetical protein [Bacteroidota bacterium]
MTILERIINKNPLEIADDDHPNRKDITEEEFSEAIKEMGKKYGQLKPSSEADVKLADQMAAGTVAALNKK